jgi:hypothetical protein
MGVNTDAFLPGGAKLDDIVESIRNLTDADKVELKMGWDGHPPSMSRGDTYVQGSDYFTLLITRADEFGDGTTSHEGSIILGQTHTDIVGGVEKPVIEGGIRVHGGNASAFWVSLLEALVDVFGGVVDYNDCDSTYIDYRVPRQPASRRSSDDADYDRVRALIENLKTVTDADGLSAYDTIVGIYNRQGEYRQREQDGTVKVFPPR